MLRAGGGRAEWPLMLRLSSHGQTPAGPVCLNTTQQSVPQSQLLVAGDAQLGAGRVLAGIIIQYQSESLLSFQKVAAL